MELELIKIMCYSFGSAIILLFIYITALALLFSRYIRRNETKKIP
jgi:hypothetical protein